MPETAVNEDCQLEFWKDEIRLAENFLIAPPAGDFIPAKEFCQRDFRVLIPARTDARHQLAAGHVEHGYEFSPNRNIEISAASCVPVFNQAAATLPTSDTFGNTAELRLKKLKNSASDMQTPFRDGCPQ